MKSKKLIITISIIIVTLLIITGFLFKHFNSAEIPDNNREITKKEMPVKAAAINQNEKQEPQIKESKPVVNICDLYSDSIYEIPLVSIITLSKQPTVIKDEINALIDKAQGIYYLGQNGHDNSVFIILQNMVDEKYRYLRHNLQTAVVNKNGEVELQHIGYTGEENEIDNAVLESNSHENWEFDESTTPLRPLKHTVFDKDGNTDFIEIWNYNEKEPIKYEMKDGENRLVSVLKETETENIGYNREHIFYDKAGKTKLSISVTYEGPNIKRFIFYDAVRPDNGIVIENEYIDGVLTEEKIYNSEYKLTNIIKAEYKNGKRVKLSLYDINGTELETFEAPEA